MLGCMRGDPACPKFVRVWNGGKLIHRRRSFDDAKAMGQAWECTHSTPVLADLVAFLQPHVADPFAWINERLPGPLLRKLYKALDPDPTEPYLGSGWQMDNAIGLHLMHRYHLGSMASRCQAAMRNLRAPLVAKVDPARDWLCPVCVSTGGLLS